MLCPGSLFGQFSKKLATICAKIYVSKEHFSWEVEWECSQDRKVIIPTFINFIFTEIK